MLFMIIAALHVVSCILLITIVLLQSGKDAGLSGAFGLGGGGQTIFGARAGDVLSKSTIVFAITFMTTCIMFTRIRPGGGGSIVSAVPEREAPSGEVTGVATPETAAGGEERPAE